MEKKKIFMILISFLTLSILSNAYFMYNNYYLKKEVLSYKENIKINKNNKLSMMLETDMNSKTYIQSTDNKWPTDGYVFNEQMSKCEQGSILKWDDANKKIIMEGNVSDKCYVFFDKYNPIKINSYTITPNGKKITISISATSGTGTITKYFYSKDDGASYVESTSNTYTFTNLAKGTYKIKAYVLDSNNKTSEYISKNIEITSMSLSEYVMSQYTGTQGENNIYYHDANLTNGAGDNSYRYSSKSAKNYVCFGTDDTTCPKDNLYRIIGLFGGNIKLVKNDYAGSDLLGTNVNYGGQATTEEQVDYMGSKKPLEKYSFGSNNTWSSSKLNTINLNTNFINNIGNKWSNMIISAVWKVGGNTSTNILNNSVRTVFTNEINNPVNNTYTAKIGLMYVSDYGYASVASRWTTMMEESSSGHANIDNYLFLRFNDWTITPNSGNSNNVYSIESEGIVTTASVNVAYGIRPAFYLKDSVMYVSGTGTISDPIRVN